MLEQQQGFVVPGLDYNLVLYPAVGFGLRRAYTFPFLEAERKIPPSCKELAGQLARFRVVVDL